MDTGAEGRPVWRGDLSHAQREGAVWCVGPVLRAQRSFACPKLNLFETHTWTNPCAAAAAAAAGCAVLVLVGLRQVVVAVLVVVVWPHCWLSVRLSWRTCRQHLGS